MESVGSIESMPSQASFKYRSTYIRVDALEVSQTTCKLFLKHSDVDGSWPKPRCPGYRRESSGAIPRRSMDKHLCGTIGRAEARLPRRVPRLEQSAGSGYAT